MATLTAENRVEPQLPVPFAKLGVSLITLASLVLLLVFASRYGYFGDELYFLAAGHRLEFSYADQGPVLPLLAYLMDSIAPGSVFALRVPAALITAGAVFFAGLLAREFGGGKGAQLLSATAYASSFFLFLQGHILATNTVDTALWVLITWFLVRWVRTGNDLLLLGAGIATAVDMQVKWLIPFFWLSAGVAVLLLGPRRMLTRPMLWLGAAIVVLSMLPSLVWQANHGWPQLGMSSVVASEQEFASGRPLFIPLAIALAGVLGVPLLCYGLWRLVRAEHLRDYRFLVLTTALLFAVFLVLNGREYYVAGIFAALMAAGAAELGRRRLRIPGKTVSGVLTSASIGSALYVLPWQPADSVEPVHGQAELATKLSINGQFGWRELTASTARAYRGLAPHEREGAVLLAESYWQASALDRYGPRYGLPPVYSPSRGFGYFGAPPDSARPALAVGDRVVFDPICANLEPVGTADARLGLPGATKDVPIWRCSGLRAPWSVLWPKLRHL
ncbi:ArnT family glycosyltransferase [Sciscionella marina]|uniref:ArnT family glycosyltransferase n=1 Tax=Sciscionella marina TaxID=508770 RepID=UPI0003782C02|nr:glycosyltransferase family 39 protein [Sciscionella marina]